MKYFICSLGEIQLGIPAQQTERIVPSSQVQTAEIKTEFKIEEKSESDAKALISLPDLFRLKDRAAPHGLILKADKPVKTVLLTPRIEIEIEIPEESIHALPEALIDLRRYLRGAYFTDETVILILDPEKLTESMRRSQ